jgi:hypothetical protein
LCGFPADPSARRGRPQLIDDDELPVLMVAQMLLQCPSDRDMQVREREEPGRL